MRQLNNTDRLCVTQYVSKTREQKKFHSIQNQKTKEISQYQTHELHDSSPDPLPAVTLKEKEVTTMRHSLRSHQTRHVYHQSFPEQCSSDITILPLHFCMVSGAHYLHILLDVDAPSGSISRCLGCLGCL